MKKFKALFLMLAVPVLILCFHFSALAADGGYVYSSDEAWPETVTNTTEITNDDEIWTFKYSLDSGSTYSDYTLTAGNNTYYFVAPNLEDDGTYDYTYVETSGNHTRVFRAESTTTDPSTQGDIIGKWWMKPAGATTRRVAKVFTAPYTGKITISAKDESGDAKIYSKAILDGNTAGPVLYIIKKTTGGESTEIWKQIMDYSGSNGTTQLKTLSFGDIDIEVSKGEEIWFVVSGEQSANGKTKFVYWNPVISYNTKYAFSSDEAWPETVTNTTEITNNDEIWNFKYSTDDGSTYTEFSASGGNNTYWLAAPQKNNDGTYDYAYVESSGNHTRAFWNGSGDITTSGDALGKWWIKLAKATNRRVAKVFISPYSGTINISAKDESGDAKIYSRAIYDGAQKGPVLYIVKKTADGESVELWKQAMDFSGSDGSTIQLKTYSFDELSVEVNEGEEIWFIVSSEQSANDRTKYVYWNPTVTYENIAAGTPEFTSAEGNELATFEDVVSAGKINVTLPVSTVLITDTEAVMCVAVYNADGTLSDVQISSKTTIPGSGSTYAKISDMSVKNITDGYVKVFLFDSMETLVPLSDIGTTKQLWSTEE